MSTPYTSQQPVDDFSLGFADTKYSVILAATTDTTLTIPGIAPAYKALIKATGAVWVAIQYVNNPSLVATLPVAPSVGTTLNATNSELVDDSNRICRHVRPGDILHFITATASTEVSVSLYTLTQPI